MFFQFKLSVVSSFHISVYGIYIIFFLMCVQKTLCRECQEENKKFHSDAKKSAFFLG